MIYAVDQQNRSAYRAQIDQMFCSAQSGAACESQFAGPGTCGQNACPICNEDCVALLDIDARGRPMSGMILDLNADPVAVAMVFAEPQSIVDALDDSNTPEGMPPAQLLVAMLEYTLAIGVTEIDISCNLLILAAALDPG